MGSTFRILPGLRGGGWPLGNEDNPDINLHLDAAACSYDLRGSSSPKKKTLRVWDILVSLGSADPGGVLDGFEEVKTSLFPSLPPQNAGGGGGGVGGVGAQF